MLKALCGLAAVVVLGLASGGGAQEAPKPVYSAVTVEKMHCDGCAKRIGGKLQEIKGVAAIQYDVKKKTLWIHPQPNTELSPRALWEAVEQAQDRPIQLFTPRGVYTAKPQS